ncbi:uncharacterized protein G2W53_044529 [Senna tora]|uniref:Uncharacterized protein n=1 Tax=Senna tora TaxID=362788 RepID=A0A834SCF3_9FABA|nr:uncharacterized protein G2W53_044529 [Senna tora]
MINENFPDEQLFGLEQMEGPCPREKLKKSVDKVSNLKGMKEKHLRRKVMSQRKKGSLASSSKGGKRFAD